MYCVDGFIGFIKHLHLTSITSYAMGADVSPLDVVAVVYSIYCIARM